MRSLSDYLHGELLLIIIFGHGPHTPMLNRTVRTIISQISRFELRMQRNLSLIFLVVVLCSLTQCASKRRADRTSSGKAAYGVATVRNGKVKRTKKARRQKAAKARKQKDVPSYRKKDPWAG